MGKRIGIVAAILCMSSGSIWGAGWREINSGLPTAVAGAGGLAIDPTTPSTLYSWGSVGALFKSTDGAVSWKIINGVTGVSWLVVDPTNALTIYAGTSRGVVKSANGGVSWTFVNTAPDRFLPAPLVVDPQDADTLYAVTFGSGIIKSSDAGTGWKTLPGSQVLPSLRFLTVDPVTRSTLYAVGDGIFKSIDGGETWTSIKARQEDGGPLQNIQTLAVDPVTPSTIYAGGQLWGLGPSCSEGIIYKSADAGQNWSTVRAGIPAGAPIASLAIDAKSPFSIYATYIPDRLVAGFAAGNEVVTECGGWGIIKSTDRGETWTVMNAGLPSGDFTARPLVIDPRSPETLYVGYVDRSGTGVGGIVKSTDGAASWKPANAGRSFIDVRAMAIDPMNADTMYASIGSDGVFKSVDRGGNWAKLASFQFSAAFGFSGRGYARFLAVDFLRPNTLYALTARTDGASGFDELLFKSTDSGASWSSVSPPGSGCAGLSAITMDPTDPNTLYVSGMDCEGEWPLMYKSTDGGVSWSDRLFNCCDNAVAIDRTNPASLYGGTPSGVMKSNDGGATWTRTGLSAGANVLALDPANPSILYAAAGGSELSGLGGVFKSTDGGVSWLPINEGLASLMVSRSRVTAFVIDPANPQVVYAGTSGYGVFRSTDGGAHWSPFNDSLPNLDIRLLIRTAGRANTLYAGTGSGIFGINIASETVPLRARSRR